MREEKKPQGASEKADVSLAAAEGGDIARTVSGGSLQPRTPGGTFRPNFAAGFVVALVAGLFMGSNFDPPTYLQQIGPPAHSSDSMDYVISHFAGIVLATLLYFGAYLVKCKASKQAPFVDKKMIVPGLLAGIMWDIAQIGWFKANTVLSYVIAFPIIVATPGVLAAIWGIVLFGENRGRRNLSLLGLVIVLQIVGVSIIAMSKGDAK